MAVNALYGCLHESLKRLLQAAGQMSLSAHLLQSVVLGTLSFGYGVGLLGRLSPLHGVILVVSVWMGLSLFAMHWLRYARFGPLEWLLRTFSYRSPQPLLRRQDS